MYGGRKMWGGGGLFFSNGTSNSTSVSILLPLNLDYELCEQNVTMKVELL